MNNLAEQPVMTFEKIRIVERSTPWKEDEKFRIGDSTMRYSYHIDTTRPREDQIMIQLPGRIAKPVSSFIKRGIKVYAPKLRGRHFRENKKGIMW